MPKTLFATNIPLENILVPLLVAFWMLLIAGAVRIRKRISFKSTRHSYYKYTVHQPQTHSHKNIRTADLR